MSPMSDEYGWQGRDLVGSDGSKIGNVKEIYEDERTGKPEWATVTSGLFGMKSHFVPLTGAQTAGEDLRVPVTKDQVKDAPSIEGEGALSEAEERRLFEHYNIPYTEAGSTTAQGAPRGDREQGRGEAREKGRGEAREKGRRGGNEAMTRSEEELRVGTTQRETGRVRLRKHVVTEQVTKTVPVQREKVRVEREPITEGNRGQGTPGPEISDQEHEVILHEEEPVVEKRAVPKERVRLDKDTATEERKVSEEVRKEQIETEGADRTSRGRRR